MKSNTLIYGLSFLALLFWLYRQELLGAYLPYILLIIPVWLHQGLDPIDRSSKAKCH